MKTQRLQIPGGMQDTLPGECHAKREMEAMLRALFGLHGYAEIETPILEYYDALDDETYGYRPEHVWKTFDRAGRILAVRPDSTIPAVRLATGALSGWPLPLRLCYLQSATEYEQDALSMLCEQAQAGVELMGESAPESDAEVISLAVEALRKAGLKSFQVELGQAGFFTGFMREAGLTEEQIAVMRRLTEEKNTLGIQLYLRESAVSEDIAARLMRLPRLYGGVEVLDEAESLTAAPACREALQNLRQVIEALKAFGCEDIAVDLGMVHTAGYYTGSIFNILTGEVGQPLVSGGRYDRLPALYGRAMPAVGFALRLKLLMIALERQGASFVPPVPQRLIAFDPGCQARAAACAAELRGKGVSAVLAYGITRQEAAARIAAGQALSGLYVSAAGVEELKEVDPDA